MNELDIVDWMCQRKVYKIEVKTLPDGKIRFRAYKIVDTKEAVAESMFDEWFRDCR